MAPVNDEKRLDMHLETASLQAVVLFLPVLFKLVNGAILFPEESKGVCTQRIRYVVGYNSIEAWLFSARRDEENRISSRSFIATQNVPYKESYRSYTWGIFWTTKYRWNNRKEVKRFVKFPSFDKIDSIELFFYPVLHRLSHRPSLLQGIRVQERCLRTCLHPSLRQWPMHAE